MRENKYLVITAYAVAAVFVLTPLVDMTLSIAPYRLGDMRWRFGALGLISGHLLHPIAALAIAYFTAATAGHRISQRVIAVIAGVGALVLLATSLLFTLDAFQVRATIREAGKGAVLLGLVAGFTKFFLAAVGLTLLAFCAWRSSRRGRKITASPDIIVIPSESRSAVGAR